MSAPRLLVIEIDRSDPVGRLGEWLTDAGVTLDVRDASGCAAEPSAVLADVDGLLVLGHASVTGPDGPADVPAQVRALFREAVSAQLPTLGLGRGGQLLAQAHGARLGPDPDTAEYGPELIAKRAAAATDPLFGPMPITPDVIQWHSTAIVTPPPGGVHLASAPACDLQALRVGRLAWALQFHIETTPELIRTWAEQDASAFDRRDLDAMLSRSDAVHSDIAEVWAPFAAAFADVIRSPDDVGDPHLPRTSTAAPVTDAAAIRAALAAEANTARTPLPDPVRRDADR